VSIALKAAEILADYGISAEVLDVASIKPLDISTLSASVARTARLVTAEEHSIVGGLGSACAEALSEKGIAFRLRRIGVRDCYTESGPYDILLAKYGISADEIVKQASALIS